VDVDYWKPPLCNLFGRTVTHSNLCKVSVRRMRLFKLINTLPTLFESVIMRNKTKAAAPPVGQPGQVAKKKRMGEDRPTEARFPSGRLLKADDVTPALKGRQAEVRKDGSSLVSEGWGPGPWRACAWSRPSQRVLPAAASLSARFHPFPAVLAGQRIVVPGRDHKRQRQDEASQVRVADGDAEPLALLASHALLHRRHSVPRWTLQYHACPMQTAAWAVSC
jgi:hypothetical protein